LSSSEEEGVIASNVEGLESRVLGIVATWIVGGILAFRDQVTAFILVIQEQFLFALTSGGGAIADAVGAVGSVPLLAIDALETSLSSVAATAGPFAPLVVVLAWAFAVFATLALLRFLVWVVPLVIPWL